LIEDRLQNQEVQTTVDKSVRLRELIQVNAGVGGKLPVVFGLYLSPSA
jgi:hypothetical protein